MINKGRVEGSVARFKQLARNGAAVIRNAAVIMDASVRVANGLLGVRNTASLDPTKVASPVEALFNPVLTVNDVQGDIQNLAYQSDKVAVHTTLSNGLLPRIANCFISQNSGFALFARRSSAENANLKWTASEQKELPAPEGKQRIGYQVAANQSSIRFTSIVLESVRSIRDQLLNAPPPGITYPLRCDTVIQEGEKNTVVSLARTDEHSRSTYEALLTFPAGTKVTQEGEGLLVNDPSGKPLSFAVEAQIPFAPHKPLPIERLVKPEALKALMQLDPSSDQGKRVFGALQALRFMAYEDKYVAGMWRFPTYFGRDSILATMMNAGILTDEGLEITMRSVLDRVNEKGEVAHEENIGSFAEREHASKGDLDAAKKQKPIHDVSMVDTEFMLTQLVEEYLSRPGVTPEKLAEFLSKACPDGGTRADALNRVLKLIADKANQYDGSKETLIAIKPGHRTGCWRDSNTGPGGGNRIGNINISLVPGALDSAAKVLRQLNQGQSSPEIERLEKIHNRWTVEHPSKDHFRVHMSPSKIRRRLASFLADPDNASHAERLKKSIIADGITVEDFIAGKAIPEALKDGYTFQALSLDEKGKPVEVVNSDSAFTLFMGSPTAKDLEEILPSLELPYPLGLIFPDAGLVTANPALVSSRAKVLNDTNDKVIPLRHALNRTAYHGTVIWGWPQAMMQLGLMKQIERLSDDPASAALLTRMEKVLQKLGDIEAKVGNLADAELYGVDDEGRAEAMRQPAGSEAEPNRFQLWSSVYPAIFIAKQRLFAKRMWS